MSRALRENFAHSAGYSLAILVVVGLVYLGWQIRNPKAKDEANAARQSAGVPAASRALGPIASPAPKAKTAEQARVQKAAPVGAPADALEMSVERSVKGWAAAWSARKLDDYFAAYAPNFAPEGINHQAWKKQPAYRDHVAKTLLMVKPLDRWLIAQESLGKAAPP